MRRPSLPKTISHVTALWVVIILLAGASVFAVIRAQEAQQHANDGQRTGWCYVETLVLKNPRTTQTKRRKTIAQVNHLLSLIHEPPCTK